VKELRLMRAVEMAKAYEPASFEGRIYQEWETSGAFMPKDDEGSGKQPDKMPFVVVIPPPNVTGVLHLGHGLQYSLEDIAIRFHRMCGEPTLWVPGTDHAGIATQNVVEKRLKAKGLSRSDLGREQFIEETWKVKEEHHAFITKQLRRMGASCDWSRERFTMDEGLSKAVREVFVSLYERNLLYKGNYLVNWCSSCGTALADDEVDHEETPGKMYHIRYKLIGEGERFLEIATTRPETLLGDTAVAIHPEDCVDGARYAGLEGKQVELPLTGKTIPVIADEYVDREFGTGVVKITPAHDPNDWEVGKRHGLEAINILNGDGTLNDKVPEKYRGLSVKAARKAVLEDLKAAGLYIKETDISHSVGHCYRCHTVIEPFLSEQWFVRMKPLAEKALQAWKQGNIIFYPKRWENTYKYWLENIRDWCISRQIWWGHRIPAWYCKDCGEMIVARSAPEKCPTCGSTGLKQDSDVLDTWFSSWLWPFSTMGWVDESCGTSDYKRFYPTTAMLTGYDIIFFWVARMVMAGLEFTGKAPFRDIYLTGIVRDKQGRKMSKSLGNGVDPLDIIDQYGADSLRFTLAFLCAQGQDILIDKESFKVGSKFANKVWNASRYILMNLEGRKRVANPGLEPADRWIYSRLNSAAKNMREAFLSYRFNDASQTAYEYFWNDFCDWYVEATKLSMKGGASTDSGGDAEKDRAATILLDVLAESLKLLHPLLPYVTEEIYTKLKEAEDFDGLLITSAYPAYEKARDDPQAEANFGFLQDFVRSVRTLRAECTVPPDKKIRAAVQVNDKKLSAFLDEQSALVKLLANIGDLRICASTPSPEASAIGLAGNGWEALVNLAEAVDMAALRAKFEKELEKDARYIAGLESRLSNEAFISKAPPGLVESEKVKLQEAQQRQAKLAAYIQGMKQG
jgi:valyl-tRNA synthetase